MTTLAQYRQRMLALDPDLGRVENIASLPTEGNAIVVTRLAVGNIDPDKFIDTWLLRPEAASQPADRLRFCHDYNPRTGELFHDATAYADKTVDSEEVEIHVLEPYLLDEVIQHATRTTRFLDEAILPTRLDGRYSLHDLAWIRSPSDLVKVGRRASPVITPNRHMQKWFGYDSSGLLVPDRWTLAGSGATFARSTTTRDPVRDQYSLSVTRVSNNASVAFTVGLLTTGASSDDLQGQTVTGVVVGQSANASSLFVTVTDGVDTTKASTGHTGGSDFEEITAEHAINAAGTTLTVTATVEVDEAAIIAELYLMVGTLSDDVRRDAYRTAWETVQHFQQQSPLILDSFRGRGEQLVIVTERPYQEFTASRVLAGTADADVHDAPLDLIAYGALSRLYETRRAESADDVAKAADFRDRYKQLAEAHLYVEPAGQRPGIGDRLLPPATSVRVVR